MQREQAHRDGEETISKSELCSRAEASGLANAPIFRAPVIASFGLACLLSIAQLTIALHSCPVCCISMLLPGNRLHGRAAGLKALL